MAPAKSNPKTPNTPSEKKYATRYVDMEDEHSPPPPNGVPLSTLKSKSKTKSTKGIKRKHAPKERQLDSDDPVVVEGPVVDYFASGHFTEPDTPLRKVSKSRSRTRIRRCSGPRPAYDKQGNCIIQGESIASGGDISQDECENNASQDGQGDPNLSAICPPLPDSLVEPKLQGHETGFHVITSGTTVGISPFIGIAQSYLLCSNPSMATFSSWDVAKAYYNECFGDDSVRIREFREEHTPTQSPVHKRQKVRNTSSKLTANALVQPHFAPAVNPTTPLGSPSVNSVNFDGYSPLVFPESPLSKSAHHGVQETTTDFVAELANTINKKYLRTRAAPIASIRSDSQPPAQAPTPSPQTVRPRVIVDDSSDEDEAAITGTTNVKGNNRPRVIVIDSSSDEDATPAPVATNFKGNKYPRAIVIDSSDEDATPAPAATNFKGSKYPRAIAATSSRAHSTAPSSAMNSRLPAPTSPLFVKFNSNPPARAYSDNEELLSYSSDIERQLDELLGEDRAGRRKRGSSPTHVAQPLTVSIDSDEEVRLF